jgi:hypothetical protein
MPAQKMKGHWEKINDQYRPQLEKADLKEL